MSSTIRGDGTPLRHWRRRSVSTGITCRGGRRGLFALLWLVPLAANLSCASFSERLQVYRSHYGSGAFPEAQDEIDRLIAEEVGVAAQDIRDPRSLLTRDVSQGNAYLLVLEKAMTSVSLEDPDGAIDLLRAGRDQLDAHFSNSAADYVKSLAMDDATLDYAGADYEHVMVRVMLTICDLLMGGQDSYAYALQIGEKQEEIIGSSFGESEHYKPRESYKRVAIGAYMEGVKREAELASGDAALAYERAIQYWGDSADDSILKEAYERARNNKRPPPGYGVLHVFYLAGRGPSLQETTTGTTELATRIAGVLMAVFAKTPSALIQAPVPVPAVQVSDSRIASLQVVVAGGGRAATQAILDVNALAIQQLEANMPWIVARAMVRRALKAAAAAGVEYGVAQGVGGSGGDLAAFAAGAVTNLILTASERADTRNWSSLPAEIQVARLELPEGEQEVSFDGGRNHPVRIRRGYDSYVVLLRPALRQPGVVLIDDYSRFRSSPPSGAQDSAGTGNPQANEVDP